MQLEMYGTELLTFLCGSNLPLTARKLGTGLQKEEETGSNHRILLVGRDLCNPSLDSKQVQLNNTK